MNNSKNIGYVGQENGTNRCNADFKADEIITCTDWRGNKNTFYKKTIGTSVFSCLSLEELKETVENHKPINHDAAAEWYGKGIYTGD